MLDPIPPGRGQPYHLSEQDLTSGASYIVPTVRELPAKIGHRVPIPFPFFHSAVTKAGAAFRAGYVPPAIAELGSKLRLRLPLSLSYPTVNSLLGHFLFHLPSLSNPSELLTSGLCVNRTLRLYLMSILLFVKHFSDFMCALCTYIDTTSSLYHHTKSIRDSSADGFCAYI